MGEIERIYKRKLYKCIKIRGQITPVDSEVLWRTTHRRVKEGTVLVREGKISSRREVHRALEHILRRTDVVRPCLREVVEVSDAFQGGCGGTGII